MRNKPLKGLMQKESPLKHPAVPKHKNPHPKKTEKTENQKKKEFLKKYPGGVMPL